MRGPYLLEPLRVDMLVPSRVGGIYCLAKNAAEVAVVGRAESGLREEIKGHAAEYRFFWYEPTLTARDCFVHHCETYHRYAPRMGIGAGEHPKPPEKLNDAKCPVCGQ